eukprot:gene9946-biopygen9239
MPATLEGAAVSTTGLLAFPIDSQIIIGQLDHWRRNPPLSFAVPGDDGRGCREKCGRCAHGPKARPDEC